MAELLADIKLRWYDDSALMADEPRELLELFLDSIGVTSDVACDIIEVMLMSRARDVPLTTPEVKAGIVELRRRRGVKDDFGLTDRNIQIWLSYFERIGLLDVLDGKHRFTANKKPTEAFKKTKQVVSESLKYSESLLSKVEASYQIR
ncbi:MAG: hypothetical protein V1744_06195 [Candidatus Altiarchaeota archaeon]